MDIYEISESFNTLSDINKKYLTQRLKFLKDDCNWIEFVDELLDIFDQDLSKKEFDQSINKIVSSYSIDYFHDLLSILRKYLKQNLKH